MPVVVFRCDASAALGAGHLSRCLALAGAFAAAGWSARFVAGAETPSVVPDLASRGFGLHVLAQNEDEIAAIGAAAQGTADLIVIDHYGRDAAFEADCRRAGRQLLAFDDAATRRHDCDVLVDAAGDLAQYQPWVPERARVLTGPDYAIVSDDFRRLRPMALNRHDGRNVENILVSCGATDPGNITATVLEALAGLPCRPAITVVLSSRAPHLDALKRRFGSAANIVTDATNMAELVAAADIAIGSPGVSAYERATLGLPSILITWADNQRGIARMLIEGGAALDAGAPDAGLLARIRDLTAKLIEDAKLRRAVGRAAATLIHGDGAGRIVDAVS